MTTNVNIHSVFGCTEHAGPTVPVKLKPGARPSYVARNTRLRQQNRELKRQLEALKRQISIDSLTGVLNRQSLDQILVREWEQASPDAAPLCCVMIDIDYFKKINDTHGHAVGDHVIQLVAKLLQGLERETDRVARFGGEEFCVVMPDTTEDAAVRWAESVRSAIAALEIRSPMKTFSVTASLGVAQRRPSLPDVGAFVDAADQALLVAKQQGRNRVVQYASIVGSQDAAKASLFHRLTAKEVMTPLVASLKPQQTLVEAANLLLLLRVDSLPVLNDEGAFVGLIGEEDLTAHSLSSTGWYLRVEDIMSDTLSSFEECDPASNICSFLSRLSIRRVVVVCDGVPTGIVSRAGLIRWFYNHLMQTAGEAACPLDSIGNELETQMAATISLLQNQVRLLQDEQTLESGNRGDYHIGAISRIQELSVSALNLSSIQHARDLVPGTARLSEFTA